MKHEVTILQSIVVVVDEAEARTHEEAVAYVKEDIFWAIDELQTMSEIVSVE